MGKRVPKPDREKAREYAGVGVMIHKSIIHLVRDIRPSNGRLMEITINTAPKLHVINVYAPQADVDSKESKDTAPETTFTNEAKRKKEQQELLKEKFYENVDSKIKKCQRSKQIVMVVGDLNANLGTPINEFEAQVLGEELHKPTKEEILGMREQTRSNRDHAISLAADNSMIIANSWFKKPWDKQVTYRKTTAKASVPVTEQDFSAIDHWLIARARRSTIKDIHTEPKDDVDSDHIPSICDLKVKARESCKKQNCKTIYRGIYTDENREK